jgi:hypothetical protein
MKMTEILQYLSVGIEVLIAVIGILIGVNKKPYGWFIFLTFTIYVFYDLARLIPLDISEIILYPVFFIGTLSIFVAIILIYREQRKQNAEVR